MIEEMVEIPNTNKTLLKEEVMKQSANIAKE